MTAAELKPRPRLPDWLRIKLPTSDSFARTRSLRKREVSESLGMLGEGHGDVHDRRRPLHPRLRLLRGVHGQAVAARSG
jgi:hypothetical protein